MSFRLTPEDDDMISRLAVDYPKFTALIERMKNKELEELPSASAAEVLKFQGRALMLQELHALLKEASDKRTTQRQAMPVQPRPYS